MVAEEDLQLAGVTAFFLASKLDEWDPGTIDQYVDATLLAVTSEQIVEYEMMVLKALDFYLIKLTCLQFLDHFCAKTQSMEVEQHMAR